MRMSQGMQQLNGIRSRAALLFNSGMRIAILAVLSPP
jgi:hypothetical protein